ncbi:major facilitator superfamily domain-containing protein [Macrophomina phaseolina]|uniref:Major facilitator superfamily domain-containing protein n=1 Tax=Macrophomina phaseolina TaxID=35725 RepID=A0ABQ8G6Z2_9PEZI|nr:major facilitator superfamily domain-containing protein [Macrophomina phaseolina]
MSRFEAISAPSAPLEEDEAPSRCPAPPQAKAARPASNLDGSDLEKQPTVVDTRRPTLEPTISHVSTHDIAHVPTAHTGGPPVSDEVYDRFTLTRKNIITAVLSFCGFLAPISSTTILAAIPEVAETYASDGTTINISNALYMLFMGISPMFWGPIGQVYGRRWASLGSAFLFTAFSVGTALAPNLASYFVFRIMTAIQGTSFLIIGSACIGDIFRPTERGTALAWFLSGTLVGPAFGPFIGGIIVTFRSWRDIFWLQTALGGFGFTLILLLLPETTHYKRSVELAGLSAKDRAVKMWQWTNPFRVLKLYRYPNLITVGFASSSLVWNMYSLLTPIRYVLNPRFHLTSPIQSGLFYIAPGCGYLFGTFFGGRWADRVVHAYIRKRGGERVPEDRLNSCLPFLGGVIPACMLIYGWSIEMRKGGIALPVIVMFLQGVAQLFCFPSLNTYCLDVMQARSAEVVAGNYVFRYVFAALGSALCLPAIEKIGVGGFSTISAGFLVTAMGLTWLTTRYGREWRDGVDAKIKASRADEERARARGEEDEDGA